MFKLFHLIREQTNKSSTKQKKNPFNIRYLQKTHHLVIDNDRSKTWIFNHTFAEQICLFFYIWQLSVNNGVTWSRRVITPPNSILITLTLNRFFFM